MGRSFRSFRVHQFFDQMFFCGDVVLALHQLLDQMLMQRQAHQLTKTSYKEKSSAVDV